MEYNITKHDWKLIRQARKMNWEDIAGTNLEDQAETLEGKKEIHNICMLDFFRAEYQAGLL